jgi:predicted O-methyltransferase YrrM
MVIRDAIRRTPLEPLAKWVARPILEIHRGYKRRVDAKQRLERLSNNVQLRFAPPGHFYCPLPDLENFPRSTSGNECLGIELHEREQCDMFEQMLRFYSELPFSEEPGGRTRFYYRNNFFGHSDAIVLFSMMRHHRPRTVIEIGSGFSSAVMLDTNELFLDNRTRLVFVEPYPARLRSLLKPTDQCEIVGRPVQELALDAFAQLTEGDILFVDSSHVSKYGSDVNDIFFRILPALAPGVLVHFHDVLWPFEYPEIWVRQGRAWNECYLLRAFLYYNKVFKIIYFNDFMARKQRSLIETKMPLMLEETGGSIWLKKVA